MPGLTSRAALPYPLPTDPLAQGAAEIKALADRLDALSVNFYAEKVEAEQIANTNLWVEFPTVLSVTVAAAGKYRFEFGFYLDTGGANSGGIALAGDNPVGAEPSALTLWPCVANGNNHRVCALDLVAGQTIRMVGRDQGNAARRCTFTKRYMHVSHLIQGALAELRDELSELDRPEARPS
jgi:hypothetical protein